VVTVDTNGGFAVRGFAQVRNARVHVAERVRALGQDALVHAAQLVVSELVTNALLHGGGAATVRVSESPGGVRTEVTDSSRRPPVVAPAGERTLTGRGLHLVAAIAEQWGVELLDDGKVIWADLTMAAYGAAPHAEARLETWLDRGWDADTSAEPRYRVALGEVPTDLLRDAKSHVDNLVREFSLAAAGADSGQTATLPPDLARLIDTIEGRFAEARLMIKHQAVEAARAGRETTRLELDLPVSAADAGLEYLRALDEVDAYCRAARMLTLETPPQHRVFRRWYVEELVTQLRAAAAGVAHKPVSFQERLLQEVEHVAAAQKAFERAARLYSVTGALASADTLEAVAEAVLTEGAAALGAFGGGLLLASDEDRLVVPGTIGYAAELVDRLRAEKPDAELPAAVALRTGEPVWLESREERDARFPELAGMERDTTAMCAVPLLVGNRRLGALRLSFREARLFDDDERRFVLALASQCAQALERAQLHEERFDVSRRLQRSLLPPELPAVAGLDVAAVYHPLGRGVEIGGDFYDLWLLPEGPFAFAIGDVTGHGPEAAAVTALVRHTLRALAMNESRPDELLRGLNAAMLGVRPTDAETYCTATVGVGEAADGVRLRMASGGHPFPLVRRNDGKVEIVPLGGNLLGALENVDVALTEVTLGPGDTMVLYTDGVTDARRDGEFFDVEGIIDVLSPPPQDAATLAESVEQAVLRHTGGQLDDDLAVVVIRVPER
jgi:serine phosphatase RsbU (regulator of sigma subunit)/anti-sigma regulatory factor (Ser/Thr protein kinase)